MTLLGKNPVREPPAPRGILEGQREEARVVFVNWRSQF
jgi:hypothetical protein